MMILMTERTPLADTQDHCLPLSPAKSRPVELKLAASNPGWKLLQGIVNMYGARG